MYKQNILVGSYINNFQLLLYDKVITHAAR